MPERLIHQSFCEYPIDIDYCVKVTVSDAFLNSEGNQNFFNITADNSTESSKVTEVSVI